MNEMTVGFHAQDLRAYTIQHLGLKLHLVIDKDEATEQWLATRSFQVMSAMRITDVNQEVKLIANGKEEIWTIKKVTDNLSNGFRTGKHLEVIIKDGVAKVRHNNNGRIGRVIAEFHV